MTIDDHGHVATDAYGRTDKPGVWAVGDVTAGHALAHRAFEQGIVIAETIAGLNPKPVDEATVPQIVFSFPEAASVGLTVEQAQAREDLIEIKETNYPMLANARMLMSGTAGSLTIVSGCDAANPDTPRVLGVHMVSQMASDIIAEAEQLVGNHVPLADAARLVHPHPTFSETLGEALLKPTDGRYTHAETNQHKQVRTSAPDKMLSSVFRPNKGRSDGGKGREAEEAEHNQADHPDLQVHG